MSNALVPVNNNDNKLGPVRGRNRFAFLLGLLLLIAVAIIAGLVFLLIRSTQPPPVVVLPTLTSTVTISVTPVLTDTFTPTPTPTASYTPTPTFTPSNTPTPTITPTPTLNPQIISRRVIERSDLIVLEQPYVGADFAVKTERYGLGGVCQLTSRYVAAIVIKAGIDFKELRVTEATDGTGRIVVRLPAPTILSCELDLNQTKRYGAIEGLSVACQPPGGENSLDRLGNFVAVRDFVERARRDNILEKAGERAKLSVASLLQTTYPNFAFDVQIDPPADPTSQVLPPNCGQVPPDNWQPNANGEWMRP